MSLVGPHREDWELLIDEKDARSKASQGQQRTAMISFKLACAELAKNEMGEMVSATNMDDVECYAYKCFLDIYNSSNETKIMRDIQVVFSDEKNEWNSVIPKDYNTLHGTHINCYDDILPLNIPPKTIIKVVLYNYWWKSENDLDFLWKSKVVFLRYTDENNKVKEIKINDEKYAEYFEKHSI